MFDICLHGRPCVFDYMRGEMAIVPPSLQEVAVFCKEKNKGDCPDFVEVVR
jgi:hypothetical protein